MGKTVLVVGGGGRCHAIVDALSRSEKIGKIYCAPGNAGIASLAECVPLKDSQIGELRQFALEHQVDLTVVGPEVSLAKGVVDEFQAAGLRIFGPSKAAAVIESSKDFTKGLMAKYGIPTAAYRTFEDYDKAVDYVRKGTFPVVLKYDGLAAGKGVVIPETLAEAKAELREMLVEGRFGKGKVVIEEFLSGPEFSFMCFVDGTRVWPLTLAQDHKRAYEDDEGPNTGGMGAYTPLPFVTGKDYDFALERIMKPVAAAMVSEGRPFRGVLYGGLIKTASGIKVIEFNCRFGDPETEVVLPRLETDIYDMFSAVVDGTQMPQIRWSSQSALGFVMASKGYPGEYSKGFEIRGLDKASALEGVRIYHSGTAFADDCIVTAGGRVLMVVGLGEDLEQARERALDAVGEIRCANLFLRRDIGHWAMED
ncbi:MAG: phosphoribosylamine--glycine ligase [Bacteroidales bacterium]|nr:phosphoribosylamine--glycine ligase [Bacteroidales bacterium]